jgi:hypothetical protein
MDKRRLDVFKDVQPLNFNERSRMNDKHINTILGYMVIAVIGYFIVKAFFPYLLFAVAGLLILKFINRK